MTAAKLSSKNQMVLPREARQALGVRGGDEVLVVPRGQTVILMAKPRDFVAALRGTGRKVYRNPGRYLRKERGSWKRAK